MQPRELAASASPEAEAEAEAAASKTSWIHAAVVVATTEATEATAAKY